MVDYLMHNLWLVWTLVSIICLILELTNGDFFIMSFVVGGVAAAISAAIGVTWWLQILIFALFTILSLIFVRPFALKYLHRGGDHRVSNVEALIGREGIVTEAIGRNSRGRVQIDGDYWLAVSEDGNEIEKGEKATVVSVESIVLTVKK